MNLNDLLKNNGLTIENELLQSAAAKMQEDKARQMSEHLAGMLGGMVETTKGYDATALLAEAEAKEARERSDMVKRAFQFLLKEGNPLPFFAATFNKEAGVDWCNKNGIKVPDTKAAEWKVPDTFTGE